MPTSGATTGTTTGPTKKHKPMTKKQLAHFEKRLLEERKRVLKELGHHGETFGASQHNVGLAAAAAAVAIVVVVVAGFAVRAPLARVPENAMKFAVGVMLTSFGIFWGAEGAGATWPGGDAALLVIIPGVLLVSLGLVQWLRRAMAPALRSAA